MCSIFTSCIASCRGHDHMVVRFTTTIAIGRCLFPGTPVFPNNETDCYDRTEILLKVALNIITILA